MRYLVDDFVDLSHEEMMVINGGLSVYDLDGHDLECFPDGDGTWKLLDKTTGQWYEGKGDSATITPIAPPSGSDYEQPDYPKPPKPKDTRSY